MQGKIENAILLSIKSKFASQIYSGEKDYEFRKSPIPDNIEYVLLQENGSGKITGGIRVKEVHQRDIDSLWNEFGKGISEHDRFFEYYSDWEEGLAIEIKSAEEFDDPLNVEVLNEIDSSFTVPPQYHFVYLTEKVLREIEPESRIIKDILPDSREVTLEQFGSKTDSQDVNSLNFRPLSSNEEGEFKELFLNSPVPSAYDDINEGFIDHIIESHNKGEDPYGYFTKKKKVYTLLENDEIIGFTTTTWKRGGSVKYGPTMLKEEVQGKGRGPKLRKLIDSRLRSEGVRKAYSTIPDDAPNPFKYLIRSNYEIEAHLKNQYHCDHNELVFGKMLNISQPKPIIAPERENVDDLGFEIGSSEFDDICDYVVKRADKWYDEIDPTFVESVIEAEDRGLQSSFSKKGKRVYIGHIAGEIRCLSIATLKRGGGVKLSPVFSDVRGDGFHSYWKHVEDDIMDIDEVRKLYTHVPILDKEMVSFFREWGFIPEGIIKEPYKNGVDMIHFGKLVE